MSEPTPGDAGVGGEFPTAEVRPAGQPLLRLLGRHPSRLWLLTGVCLLLALGLVWASLRGRTMAITVRFQQGHGIKPGDVLRHRGIDVGEVSAVELNRELSGIDVRIELDAAAAGLAREGSRFWIERPQVSLSRIRGLETVVGAKYVAVLPGPPGAAATRVFEGEEAPLTVLESDALEIRIRFRDGNSLTIGDAVKHRGIVVGEVAAVDLHEDLSGVTVRVRLAVTARRLARVGSQFWVVRPDVSLAGVRGLETLVGGRYIAAVAGPADAEPLTVFDGLEQPPTTLYREAGGLEIILEGSQRKGIEAGAPITYRGLPVGHVVSVGLSPDAARVEARAYIRPAYRQLVREQTRFWSIGGINFNVGLRGVELHTDTLATIAAGGVALATPQPPGKLARAGSRFVVGEEPAGWLDWTPRIAIGTALLPAGSTLPQPVRVALVWRERRFGIPRTQQVTGWALPLGDGRLLGPGDLLSPPPKAIDGRATLEFAGRELPITAEGVHQQGGLAVRTITGDEIPRDDAWPVADIRAAGDPEECLITTGSRETIMPLPRGRLEQADGGWSIDPSFTLSSDAHGACVVSRSDGRLVGLLVIEKGTPRVAFAAVLASP